MISEELESEGKKHQLFGVFWVPVLMIVLVLDRKTPILLQGLHPMTLQNNDREKCDRIAALESKLVET